MDTVLGFATLTITTVAALFAALGLQLLLLKGAFFLMRPVSAIKPAPSSLLVSATQLLVRAYARGK